MTIEIIQTDREVAFGIWRDIMPDAINTQLMIIRGQADEDYTVQRVAEYRMSLAPAPDALSSQVAQSKENDNG